MKRIYNKPETEIIDIEPQQMICTSPRPGEDTPPEDEEWFFMDEVSMTSKHTGVLD